MACGAGSNALRGSDPLQSIDGSRRTAWNVLAAMFVALGLPTVTLGATEAAPEFGTASIAVENVISPAIGSALVGDARLEPNNRRLHLVAVIACAMIATVLLVIRDRRPTT